MRAVVPWLVTLPLLALLFSMIWGLLTRSPDPSMSEATRVVMPIVVETEPVLAFACRVQGLSAKIPADGVFPVWEIKDQPDRQGSIGLFIGPPGSAVSWGNRTPSEVYSCTLSTASNEALSDVLLEFHLAFPNTRDQADNKDAGEVANRTSVVSIPGVSPGHPFSFSVFNGTQNFIGLALPTKATFKDRSGTKRQDVPLVAPRSLQLLLGPIHAGSSGK